MHPEAAAAFSLVHDMLQAELSKHVVGSVPWLQILQMIVALANQFLNPPAPTPTPTPGA